MAALKTASFTSPGVTPPYAAEMQTNALEQQQLLEALQQQQEGQRGVRPVQAGRLSALNFEGAGNTIAELLTQKKLEIARKKQADTQAAYSDGLLEAARKYTTARDGSTTEVAGPPDETGVAPTKTTPGDPMAFKEAAMSPYPEMRAAGENDRKSYEELRKELISKASPQSVLANPTDFSKYKPLVKQEVHNGAVMQLGQEQGQVPQVVAPVTQSTLPSGTVVNNQFGGAQDAVDKAPKTNINLPGDHAMKGVIDALPKDFEGAQAANKTLRSTETALSALKAGAQSGSGEDWKQAARTFTESLTGLKFDTTTPTAVLAKALAENIVNEFGGKLGTGISNADVEFMKLALGGLATDKSAIERILAIRAASAYNKVKEHNTNVADLTVQEGVTNGDYLKRRYTLPPTKFAYEFTTPEARASFESGIGNVPYEDVFKRESTEAPKKGVPKYSPADLELFRKNGYTPRGG